MFSKTKPPLCSRHCSRHWGWISELKMPSRIFHSSGWYFPISQNLNDGLYDDITQLPSVLPFIFSYILAIRTLKVEREKQEIRELFLN